MHPISSQKRFLDQEPMAPKDKPNHIIYLWILCNWHLVCKLWRVLPQTSGSFPTEVTPELATGVTLQLLKSFQRRVHVSRNNHCSFRTVHFYHWGCGVFLPTYIHPATSETKIFISPVCNIQPSSSSAAKWRGIVWTKAFRTHDLQEADRLTGEPVGDDWGWLRIRLDEMLHISGS